MAEKYRQNREDRRRESRGMKNYAENKGEKMSPRYARENKGSMDAGYMGMISEDHTAPSNLPQNVVHNYYPKSNYVDNYYLDDTIKGIDDNSDDTIKKVESHQSDSMY